jgi:hypothetical protein
MSAAFATSTKTAYACQIKKYLTFCKLYDYQPVPVSTEVLCKYAAYLAQSCCYTTVKQYLNAVRLVHLEYGHANPLQDNFQLKLVLKGIERTKGNAVSRKCPITVDVLKKFLTVLDLNDSQCVTFWAACLVAFYGMLRKSSLFPKAVVPGHMCVANCLMHEWGMQITLLYSKTIQCKERRPFVALPWNAQHKELCPVKAVLKALHFSRSAHESDYLFAYLKGSERVAMSYHVFTAMLKNTLEKAGLSTTDFSGHSLRRGGATCAFLNSVPVEVIKGQGDWKTLSYLDYIDQSDATSRAQYICKMYK